MTGFKSHLETQFAASDYTQLTLQPWGNRCITFMVLEDLVHFKFVFSAIDIANVLTFPSFISLPFFFLIL